MENTKNHKKSGGTFMEDFNEETKKNSEGTFADIFALITLFCLLTFPYVNVFGWWIGLIINVSIIAIGFSIACSRFCKKKGIYALYGIASVTLAGSFAYWLPQDARLAALVSLLIALAVIFILHVCHERYSNEFTAKDDEWWAEVKERNSKLKELIKQRKPVREWNKYRCDSLEELISPTLYRITGKFFVIHILIVLIMGWINWFLL